MSRPRLRAIAALSVLGLTLVPATPASAGNSKNCSGYSYVSGNFSWQDANAHARTTKRGHLVTIQSAAEQACVEAVLAALGDDSPVFGAWIGAYYDTDSGGWRWSELRKSTSFKYNGWNVDNGEPNGGGIGEPCAIIGNGVLARSWYDVGCNWEGGVGYILEIG
jgi:hypothetical protein